MNRKNRRSLLIIILILFISVGFAFLSSRIDINGIANIKKIKWNIYFDNVIINTGNEFQITAPTTTGTNTTEISYAVALEDPGDSYSFDVDIVNNGTIDAMYKIMSSSISCTDDCDVLYTFDIRYKDGTEIEPRNYLPKMSKDTITVTLTYNKDISISDLPSSDKNLEYNLVLTYEQAKFADDRTTSKFDVLDLSGKGNHGINYGATNNGDGTYTLDGVDDYINCGLANYDFGKSISLVTRLKFKSIARDYNFFDNYSSDSAGIGLIISGNLYPMFLIYTDNNSYGLNSSFSPEVDTWYTIIGVYDGKTQKIYIYDSLGNNLANVSRPTTENIKISTSPFVIGGMYNTSNHYTPMTISDALIFDRALTEEEITTNYSGEINPVDKTDLLLYYDFK